MKKFLRLLLIPALLLSACTARKADDGKPVVTVTILPLRYFVEQLSGDHFQINVLVPPGASHHNYDPTPRQLQELEKSGALFINGHLGFENAWVPKMRSNYHGLQIVDLSEGVDLITVEGGEGSHAGESGEMKAADHDHEHEGVDPHYWMSAEEARKLAANMARGLIRADPACRQLVEGNLSRLDRRLDSLSQSMRQRFSTMDHRSFMIFHPALAYLARDYQMNQHSMELAGKEPTASHFRKLVDLARAEKINTIFIQKEYDQENAQTFARETGARIVVIDPMSPDWFGEMESLANKIASMDNR
jgi:zinc transport system substrate-binding protein